MPKQDVWVESMGKLEHQHKCRVCGLRFWHDGLDKECIGDDICDFCLLENDGF